MGEKVDISVIVPFYKGNKYINNIFIVINKNSIKIKSNYPNIKVELIIVNDSPDYELYQQTTYDAFTTKIIKHNENKGIHQARVTGLSKSLGEYILFLDQDDQLEEDFLLNQYKLIFRYKKEVVVSNGYIENSDLSKDLIYKSKVDLKRVNDLEFYLKSHNMIKSPGQCLIKKESIPEEWEKYIMKSNGSDDLFLWILLFEKGYKFLINNRPLYFHKYTGENLSESGNKMGKSSLEFTKFLENIDYIPKEHTIMLERSRNFFINFKKSDNFNKINIIIKNFDLFMYLLINKLKKIISQI